MTTSSRRSLADRLAAFAQHLGLTPRAATRTLYERARQLRLPFSPLPLPPASLWWQDAPPLQRLVDLPRDALSGPVQEDKAEARSMLMQVVEREVLNLDSFDLRQVDGLCCPALPGAEAFDSFEALAGSPLARHVRIISYKDFLKTISLAIPRFLAPEPVELRQASWLGERLYWVGERHPEAFACAISYARRRELQDLCLPVQLTRYRINTDGLDALRLRYHVLAMPVQAWSEPAFMALLLDTGLPYARLSLLRYPEAPEFLLLPRADEQANALGEGLRQCGAPDVTGYFSTLQAGPSR